MQIGPVLSGLFLYEMNPVLGHIIAWVVFILAIDTWILFVYGESGAI
jgi:hypothetical protein